MASSLIFVLIPIDNIYTVWYDVYKEVRYMNIDDWEISDLKEEPWNLEFF